MCQRGGGNKRGGGCIQGAVWPRTCRTLEVECDTAAVRVIEVKVDQCRTCSSASAVTSASEDSVATTPAPALSAVKEEGGAAEEEGVDFPSSTSSAKSWSRSAAAVVDLDDVVFPNEAKERRGDFGGRMAGRGLS